MRKLEIGPGEFPCGDGFETVGMEADCDYYCQWGFHSLPFDDETFDIVYSSHVLEHIPHYRTADAFSDVFRILKPGGVFECHTVDFRVIVDAYLAGTTADDWTCRDMNPDLHPMKWVASRIFAYEKPGHGSNNWHKAVFDYPYLLECFSESGFVSMERVDKPRVHDHGAINLGMRGMKP